MVDPDHKSHIFLIVQVDGIKMVMSKWSHHQHRRHNNKMELGSPHLSTLPEYSNNSNSNQLQASPVRVGFYEIQETIGRGNFAVVKLAKHRITKTEVSNYIVAFQCAPSNLVRIMFLLASKSSVASFYNVKGTKLTFVQIFAFFGFYGYTWRNQQMDELT